MKRESSFFWQTDAVARDAAIENAQQEKDNQETIGDNIREDEVQSSYPYTHARSAQGSAPQGIISGAGEETEYLIKVKANDSGRQEWRPIMNIRGQHQDERGDETRRQPLANASPHRKGMPNYGATPWQINPSPPAPVPSFPPGIQHPPKGQSIRFQVVVWHIGQVDVTLCHVSMKFRVTLFWNIEEEDDHSDVVDGAEERDFTTLKRQHPSSSSLVWNMKGRQKACLYELSKGETHIREIDVPPISILNAVSFEQGQPDVDILDIKEQPSNNDHTIKKGKKQLVRWTCMYNATLLQENMRVDQFPHDEHELTLKLGILAHRRANQKWDKSRWKLAPATENDSQGSTRIPYGLIVDQVHIPDFTIVKKDGQLSFEFVPMAKLMADDDNYLQVQVRVKRESGHYDKNVMPLLALLNVVAVSCLCRNFAGSTASTELILSICFVEIGFRLSIDSRLPSVGYQIKIQRVLNGFFRILLFLAFETNIVYLLHDRYGWQKFGWSKKSVTWIDWLAASLALIYSFKLVLDYYWVKIIEFNKK
jgi:hypothetical protein